MNHQQKLICFLVFVLISVGSLLEGLGVSMIIPLVSIIQDPGALNNNFYLYKFGFSNSLTHQQLLTYICGFVILVYIVKNIYFIFLSWIRIKFSCKIQREMSIKIMTSYLNRGYQFFLNKNFGELHRGVVIDTSAVYMVIYSGFKLISELFTIALICVFMVFVDWSLAISIMILAVICISIIFFFFRKQMYKSGVTFREYNAKAYQSLLQAFEGVKDVLLLRKQDHFIEEYKKNQINVQKAQCDQVVGAESPAFIIEGICVSGILLLVCIRLLGGETSSDFIAVLAAFAVGAFRILPSLGKIASSINPITNSIPSVDAMYQQICGAGENKENHKESITSKDSNLSVPAISFSGRIRLKGISFRYNHNLDYILEDIDFSIEKGSSIAIIGTSGAGKSTLVDILLGLLIPQEGEILLDETNIRKIPDIWAKTVGYVPQSVFLADTTIKENVAFGEDISKIDVDCVNRALKRAELDKFIEGLPEGINTYVGDRGVRLSGGQRQRIAIARALYHNPDIMVLDEATSALDNDTEAAIMSAINSLQGTVTLIIVAHRLTTVKKCDIIYEVTNKKVIKREKKEVFME